MDILLMAVLYLIAAAVLWCVPYLIFYAIMGAWVAIGRLLGGNHE